MIYSILLASSTAMIATAFLIALFKLMSSDQVHVSLVCLEVIANLSISLIAIWSLIESDFIYFDICIGLALIIFLSTIAYCQFIEGRKDHATSSIE